MGRTVKAIFDGEALLIIFGFGVVFGLGALFLHEFSLKFLILGFLFGSYCGFAALPYIDSTKWKPKPKTCAVLGMLGALLFALTSNWQIEQALLLATGGLIIGYFAPFWAKFI